MTNQNSNQQWVAGSVSTQIHQNWHAWSTDCKTFDNEQDADKYADECWGAIQDNQEQGQTVFCYELDNQ